MLRQARAMRRREILALIALAGGAPATARASESTERRKSGGASYLPIAAITGTTNRAGGRRGVLSVECGLDIPDASLRARAEALIPRLRAAYGETVRIYAAGLPPETPPNADFLARALQGQTDAVLGRRGARLLLGAILVS